MRSTKIVATLGPATDKPGMMEKLFSAGADVFRLNYSHGIHEDHAKRAQQIRALSEQKSHTVAILADLQGPKIRIAKFETGFVNLAVGDNFSLNTNLVDKAGNINEVGVTYPDLINDVKQGDILLLDDGKIEMEVKNIEAGAINCQVLVGGKLSDNKGLNLLGGGLSAAALTEKDITDLQHAIKLEVDFIAISFVRSADDIIHARKLIREYGSNAHIIAKIERAEALDNLEEIIDVSDVIMVARGDLGVEIGYAAVPPIQKQMIKHARAKDKVVITATQMMESMIENQIPTRAEVSDVANAVLDGTDAVMLSAETSVGKYPDLAVVAMANVCSVAEQKHSRVVKFDKRLTQFTQRIDESIAMAAMYTAIHVNAQAIASLTETGSTALWMSRVISGIPIFAFSREKTTCQRVSLYRGVYPIAFDITHTNLLKVNQEIIDVLLQYKMVVNDDYVIVTKGDLEGEKGGTNNMKLLKVSDSII